MARIREIMGKNEDLELAATISTLDSWMRDDPASLREATAKMRKRNRKTVWMK